ncbi:MAG: arylsulfatase [Bryobacterales bacterium]|nr:arylsulfatase [Bryobacterales bacterium]
MNRRTFLASSLGAAAAQAAGKSPNVILVITDDQGYGDLGCHGNPVIRTPHLNALHSRSVRFTNFHVSPTCAPPRSALMTGRYTNATGAWHTIMGRSLLHPEEVTLADCFRAAGYRTGIFGKWHLGDNYPCRPQDNGFEEVLVHGGGGVWQTPDFFGNDYDGDTYFHNGKPEAYKGYCTDVFFDNAMAFVGQAASQGKPFFAYVPTNAPHGPMWAPEGSEKPYENVKGLREPGFYGMIANIDDNMGRLVAFLKERSLDRNTILIYMTDNGTSSGAQVFNAGMRGNKGSAYEGGHRVPFFFHWPEGGYASGRDVTRLTAHIDVLPTLVDLCGLKKPAGPGVHGKSLRPLLEGKSAGWPDRTIVVDSQRVDELVKWRQAAVMTERWRLVNMSPDGDASRLELYDMQADAGQKNNIAASHADVVAKLSKDYDVWWKLTSGRAGKYVRIVLGGADRRVRLTCHDWHGEGSEKTWNQRGIRTAPAANGFWAVEVARSGMYKIELRRWPEEVDLPINAPYRDARPNRETAVGKAIQAVKARLRIGGVDESAAVSGTDKAAVFRVRLEKGPAKLETWFYDASGEERGAYFAYVEPA